MRDLAATGCSGETGSGESSPFAEVSDSVELPGATCDVDISGFTGSSRDSEDLVLDLRLREVLGSACTVEEFGSV